METKVNKSRGEQVEVIFTVIQIGFIVVKCKWTIDSNHGIVWLNKVRTLRDKDLIVRQKSITWVVELLCVPDNRARCLMAGTRSPTHVTKHLLPLKYM